MEFVLLALAISALGVRVASVHLVLLFLHMGVGAYVGLRLLPKQPLCSIFIGLYMMMYFLNPTALMLGWIPKGPDDLPEILYPSTALLMIGLDLFMVAVRRLRFTRLDANRMPRLHVRHFRLDLCIALAFALCAFSAAALLVGVTAMGVNVFTIEKSWFHGGGEHNIYYLAAQYAFLTLPLAVFLIGLKRPVLQIPYMIPVAVLLVLHFMIYRTRSPFIAVLIAYGVATAARYVLVTVGARQRRGHRTWALRLSLLVAVPVLIFCGVAIKYLRISHGFRDYRITPERVEELAFSTFAAGDLGYAYWLRRAMVLYGERNDYLNGQSYYRLLFVPIPRFVWPNKPENTQRLFAQAHDPDLRWKNVTIPAGIVGDLYINFGPFGVLGMLVWGLIFAQERYRNLTDLLFLAGSGWWLFHIVRGSVTVPVVFLLTMWMFAAFSTKIIQPVPLPSPPVPTGARPRATRVPPPGRAPGGAARQSV